MNRKTLSSNPGNFHLTGFTYYCFAKRLIDVVLVLPALLVLFPFLALLALLVTIESAGPAIYSQKRVGLNGKRFILYKFRTMSSSAENVLRSNKELYNLYTSNGFKLPDNKDPRITKIGYVLRRTSLDEIPQLINILKGEMTLVGPRPVIPEELKCYGKYREKLLSVKPGLTGYWQVSGHNSIPYPQRVNLDMEYIDRRSLWLDFIILIKTIPEILQSK